VPVNLLVPEGERYLVAPRGETEWVRNIRAARGGELRLGSRREPIAIIELGDAEKPPILRAYVQKWWFERTDAVRERGRGPNCPCGTPRKGQFAASA
jgi:hypothetical protein